MHPHWSLTMRWCQMVFKGFESQLYQYFLTTVCVSSLLETPCFFSPSKLDIFAGGYKQKSKYAFVDI